MPTPVISITWVFTPTIPRNLEHPFEHYYVNMVKHSRGVELCLADDMTESTKNLITVLKYLKENGEFEDIKKVKLKIKKENFGRKEKA